MKIQLLDDEGKLLDEHAMDMDVSHVGAGFIKEWIDKLMGNTSSLRIIGRSGKWKTVKSDIANKPASLSKSQPEIDGVREVSVGVNIDSIDVRLLKSNFREMSESDLQAIIDEYPGCRLRRYNVAYTVNDLEGFENIFIP